LTLSNGFTVFAVVTWEISFTCPAQEYGISGIAYVIFNTKLHYMNENTICRGSRNVYVTDSISSVQCNLDTFYVRNVMQQICQFW